MQRRVMNATNREASNAATNLVPKIRSLALAKLAHRMWDQGYFGDISSRVKLLLTAIYVHELRLDFEIHKTVQNQLNPCKLLK